MRTIAIGKFGGENRKSSEFLLQHGEAAIAENIDFRGGKFEPFRGVGGAGSAGNNALTIAWFDGELAELDFRAETAVAGVPRGGKKRQLFITAADRAPQVINEGDSSPVRLGAPWNVDWIPSHTGNPVTTGDNARDFRFALTVVMADGSESPLSKVYRHGVQPDNIDGRDGVIRMGENGIVTLGFDPAANGGVTGGKPNISDGDLQEEYKRGGGGANFDLTNTADYETPAKVFLYRSVDSGAWHKVAEVNWNNGARVSFGAQKYNSLPDSTLTAQFVGVESRPRLDMRGIGLHPKGFAFGFAGNFLCFSAREQYGVFPRHYEIEIPEGDIIAVIEYQSSLFVFAENTPPIMVVLDSPESATVQRSESAFILNKGDERTVVNMGQLGVFYAVRQGIVQLPSGRLVTEAILDEGSFDVPDFAFADEDEYFGAQANGKMFYLTRRGLEPGFMQMGSLDLGYGAEVISATRSLDGRIYVLTNGMDDSKRVGIWRGGNPLVGKWRSGKYKIEQEGVSVAWIYGDAADEHEQLYNQWVSPAVGYEGYGALPAGFFEEELGSKNAVFGGEEVISVREGNINVNVYVGIAGNKPARIDADESVGYDPDYGRIEIRLPDHAGPTPEGGAGITEDVCDCIVHCPAEVGACAWVQVEVISERRVDIVSISADIRDILDLRKRVAVFPAPGFVS